VAGAEGRLEWPEDRGAALDSTAASRAAHFAKYPSNIDQLQIGTHHHLPQWRGVAREGNGQGEAPLRALGEILCVDRGLPQGAEPHGQAGRRQLANVAGRARAHVSPAHEQIFKKYPVAYYWTAHQSEWATFRDRASLWTATTRRWFTTE
jgi:hypothetical protein